MAALRDLLGNRPDKALERLKQNNRPSQDMTMLLGLFGLAARINQGKMDGASPEEATHTLELFEDWEQRLRPQAQLSIEKLHYCKMIGGFGNYDRLPDQYAFRAGRAGSVGERVVLYIEVKNFSRRARESCYETLLDTRLEIIDRNGRRIWEDEKPAIENPNLSFTPRNDYYICCSFWVPANVSPGHYTLRLEVKDVTHHAAPQQVPPHRIARREIEFQVTAGSRPRSLPNGQGDMHRP